MTAVNFSIGAGLVSLSQLAGAISANLYSLTSTSKKVELIFQAETTNPITHLWLYYGLRTGTPPTYKISLQGVSATTGRGDGVIKGVANGSYLDFTPPADTTWNNTGRWNALGASYTPSLGEFLAIVIGWTSGSIDVNNCSSFGFGYSGFGAVNCPPPYVLTNVGGGNAERPMFAYKTASESFGLPINTYEETQFSSNSNPNEYALRFMIPGSGTFKLKGIKFTIRTPSAGKSTKFILYNGTTNVAEVTWDSDMVTGGASGNDNANRIGAAYFTTQPTLNLGTVYYLAIAPQDTSNNVAMGVLTFASLQDLAAVYGNQDFYLATRNGAAWTDVTTKLPCVELILGDLTTISPGGYNLVGER